MDNIKHVHNILAIFRKVGGFENEEQLLKTLQERFGDNVQFVTSSNKSFKLDEVVSFLTKRRKIKLNSDGSISLDSGGKCCKGGHHHHEHHHHEH